MHTKPRRGSEVAPRPRREHQPGASKPRRAWSRVESSTLLHVKIKKEDGQSGHKVGRVGRVEYTHGQSGHKVGRVVTSTLWSIPLSLRLFQARVYKKVTNRLQS